MTGKVKFFNPMKGYGFIRAHDAGPDVFVHESVLDPGTKLVTGQDVEFSLVPDYPERRALTVKLLGKSSYVPITTQRKAAFGAD